MRPARIVGTTSEMVALKKRRRMEQVAVRRYNAYLRRHTAFKVLKARSK